jgi:3-isopropylmalate/(R)-2-methylmalate dehydratase small subunit
MTIEAEIFVYGDDVNTDVIFPGKYTYTISDPNEMAKHALEDLDPDFVKTVKSGDAIVAGKNFGCGSSREQAATCIKYSGVSVIVAESFSRLFYRNAINSGLPLVVVKDIGKKVKKGEKIEVDFEKGILKCSAGEFSFPPLPNEVLGIVNAGGLIPYIRKKVGTEA